jgi:hypothetical protein
VAISFADRATHSPDVMFRTVGDEAVLMNLKTELYLGLDPVGTSEIILAPEIERPGHRRLSAVRH